MTLVHRARRAGSTLAIASTIAFVLAATTVSSAHATTITFDGLSGSNLDPIIALYDEGTFRVSETANGAWLEAHVFGNGTPSIVGASGFSSSTILITETSSGFFTFQGVDLADANISIPKVDFEIEGLLGGASQFVQSGGPLNPVGTFLTIASLSPTTVIDELLITMTTTNDFLPFNVDNIQVTSAGNPIPEPTAAICFATGLAIVGLRLRRRPSA